MKRDRAGALRKEKRYKSSLCNQMTVGFSAMAVVVVVFLIVIFYRTSITNINNQALASMESKIENQSNLFELFVENFDQISLTFRKDDEFMNILLEENPDSNDLIYIQSQLLNVFLIQKYVDKVELYIPNAGALVEVRSSGRSYIKTNLAADEIETRLDYGETFESSKYRYVYGGYSAEGEVEKTFNYCRGYIKIQDQSPLGFLTIYFNEKFYESIIEDNIDDYTRFAGIFDGNNQPILINDNAYYDQENEQIMRLLSGDSQGYLVESDRAQISMASQREEWKYLLITSKDKLQGEIRVATMQSMALLIGVITVFIMFIRVVSKRMMKPVILLADQMTKVSTDNQRIKLEVKRDDEIGYLTERFNSMLEKIDTLIAEKYVSKINENNARMKALQAQINPHFLYNSLQMISTQAMLGGSWKIVDMVDALSSTYRYSIKMGDIVSVAQERVNLENYMKINECRYGEQLRYQEEISEEVSGFIVPKFTLQILAENAIKHGMGNEPLDVTICVQKEGNQVRIYSRDSGKGFAAEKKERLLENIRKGANEVSEAHGLGLKNLYDRFSSMYGAEHVNIIMETTERQDHTKETRVEITIST